MPPLSAYRRIIAHRQQAAVLSQRRERPRQAQLPRLPLLMPLPQRLTPHLSLLLQLLLALAVAHLLQRQHLLLEPVLVMMLPRPNITMRSAKSLGEEQRRELLCGRDSAVDAKDDNDGRSLA